MTAMVEHPRFPNRAFYEPPPGMSQLQFRGDRLDHDIECEICGSKVPAFNWHTLMPDGQRICCGECIGFSKWVQEELDLASAVERLDLDLSGAEEIRSRLRTGYHANEPIKEPLLPHT